MLSYLHDALQAVRAPRHLDEELRRLFVGNGRADRAGDDAPHCIETEQRLVRLDIKSCFDIVDP